MNDPYEYDWGTDPPPDEPGPDADALPEPEPPATPVEETPLLLDDDALAAPSERRLDFERGISYFPRVTLALIAVNAVVFVWQIASGGLLSEQALIDSGALHQASVLGGEVWRLGTSLFLHGDPGHLIGNMLVLYILGMASEHAFGRWRGLGIYLFAGLTGGLLCVAFEPRPTVGASGAIFGLLGAVVVFLLKNRANLYVRERRIAVVFILWAGWQFLTGLMSPHVANLAHLGGLIGGGAAAWVVPARLVEQWARSRTA